MAHSISTHFAALPDPQECPGRRHRLDDMLTIAICGVICGADSWTEVQQLGEAQRDWFKKFLNFRMAFRLAIPSVGSLHRWAPTPSSVASSSECGHWRNKAAE